jgi:hypothetical protein
LPAASGRRSPDARYRTTGREIGSSALTAGERTAASTRIVVVRAFVLGAACAGKTTVCTNLRARSDLDLNVVDMNDEILSLNGGVWPDIRTKNEVLQPKVLDAVCKMSTVLLFNSYMSVDRMRRLRRAGFCTVLMDVSEAELRRRHRIRLREEGWDNSQWFDWNQSVIEELRKRRMFDHVISGEREPAVVAAEILEYAREARS